MGKEKVGRREEGEEMEERRDGGREEEKEEERRETEVWEVSRGLKEVGRVDSLFQQ